MTKRGVFVDHTTLPRRSIKMLPVLPVLPAAFRRRTRPVGLSWRMGETYVKISGPWKCLYRAVDRDGDTVDFLLRAKRDRAAARAFFERGVDLHGVPEKITIDKSGANTAAIRSIQADSGLSIQMRQSKYLNKLVERDHRAVKRITRTMLGFKTFRCARILIVGIAVMHMIRKSQLGDVKDQASSAAKPVLLAGFLIGVGLTAMLGRFALLRQNPSHPGLGSGAASFAAPVLRSSRRMRPSTSSITRSQRAARRGSWVTMRKLMRKSACMRRISANTSSDDAVSRLPVGSSASTSGG
jgi:putative transposase